MEIPLEELKNKLAHAYNEVDLLEILQITTFDLVERFSDRIYENAEELSLEFEEDEIDN